jgi:serine/threonine protein kinase
MAAVTPNINQTRAMRVAMKRIEGFVKQFGEAHRNLARHAAFPFVLTPDLLYQIWANFVSEAPWTAVAHVLLSRLCRQVGYEMYEMDIADRNLLLRELKEQFGQERLDELGEFLLDYVAQRLNGDDPDTQDLAQAQEWTALAYTKPCEAAHELAKGLSERVKQENVAELLRLTSLVETFVQPLVEAGFEPLLVYTRGMGSFVRGDKEGAKAQFSKLSRKGSQVEIAGENLDIPLDLSTPQIIALGTLVKNRYQVVQQLGSGGFAETFQVDDNGTLKCLKVLRMSAQEQQIAVTQFQREAELLSQLHHPGIPKAEPDGYFTWPENSLEPFHCLAMEFLEGLNLAQWLANNGAISQDLALNWLQQLTEILDYLHQQRLVHRGIKPNNIMLKPNGQLALVDFGEVVGSEGDELMIGTPGYMPPEQMEGKAVLQSDFFGLGRTFVHLLTGLSPTELELESDTGELVWRNAAPQVSKHLADLIDELMAYSPGQRPRNTQVILQRIKAINSLVKGLETPKPEREFQELRSTSNSTPLDLLGSGEIRIIGDRGVGKTTYMATLACLPNVAPNSPIQEIQPLNVETYNLINRAKDILEQGMALAPTAPHTDADDLPLYNLEIILKPRFLLNPIAAITGRNIRIQVSCREYPGELITDLLYRHRDNYLFSNYLDDCVSVSKLLLMIDGVSYRNDPKYAQAFANLAGQLKLRLDAQKVSLSNYRIAVVFSKIDRPEIWINRNKLELLMAARFPQTQVTLQQWTNAWGCSVAYFGCSAFGMIGNPPQPNAIAIGRDHRGTTSVLASPQSWKPLGIVAPIYWLHTGKYDPRLGDI